MAQDMLSELIELYKAHEEDSHKKYAYHFYVRPPRTAGADLAFEAWMKSKDTMQ